MEQAEQPTSENPDMQMREEPMKLVAEKKIAAPVKEVEHRRKEVR
jgi:hypothetical protein